MNLREARKLGEGYLREAGIADALTDARLLQEWVMGISMADYALDPLRPMPEEQERAYMELIGRRCRRIPLQHLTGEQEFMGLSFRVNPDVLIPRQDTELLTEEALCRLRPGMSVLDLCTGSGCIIISLEQIGKTRGCADETNIFTGSDISPAALLTAEENARLHGAEVSFVESDLFERLTGTYDMIVSNPPYIRTAEIGTLEDEVRLHDPVLALDGKEDGLFFYRRILKEAGKYLKRKGLLLLETGADQGEEVAGLMEEAGYGEIHIQKDLAGLDRLLTGRYDK